jgi:predicted RNA-binding Zn ribbon-like protein
VPDLARGYWLSTATGRRFAFDAGALCLEFATTGGEGWRKRWETIHQPADLAGWAVRSRLGAAAAVDPGGMRLTPGDLAAASALREAIWHAATALALGRPPRRADLDHINAAAAAAPMVPAIGRNDRQRRWVTPVTGAQLLSTVARDAIELFTGPNAARIRQCDGPRCSLVFADTSRPGQRRWCSMERCGNIGKQRALRARRRLATEGSPPAGVDPWPVLRPPS